MEKVSRKINLKDRTKYAIEKSKEIRNMHREDKCECTIETSLAYDMQDVEEYIKQLEREMQRKAEKYVLLVEKLKEMRKSLNKDGFVGYADEITDILVEIEED